MKLLRFLLLILLSLSLQLTLWAPHVATASERLIDLEWERDPDAELYEIEIGAQGSQRALHRHENLKTPGWSGSLKPGRYWMRVRGRDDRLLPGEWSEIVEFQVKIGYAQALSPKNNAILNGGPEKSSVTLQWEPVTGAHGYSLIVLDDKQTPVHTQRLTATQVTLNLASAMKYGWMVQATDESGNVGEKPDSLATFTLEGPVLQSPELKKPETPFVRRVDFARPLDADYVRVSIQRFDDATRDWVRVTEGRLKTPQPTGHIPFQPDWPGGRYQLTATSEAKYRGPSSVSEISFEVAPGDRSEATENRAFIRKAIERNDDWFLTLSYIASRVNYKAQMTEENRLAQTTALTGTGLVGGGRFWQHTPYGVFGSLDYGGITMDGKTQRFLGLEATGLLRWSPQRESDLRFRLGVFHQQVPQLVQLQPNVQLGTLTALGPVSGIEYWYSYSPRIALQASLAFRHTMKGTSATGRALTPSTSYNAGIMGGLRLGSGMTGLMGYSYRNELYRYPGANPALGITDGKNELSLSGHFLQMVMEYDY
jgi:hypothetical protein